MGDLRIPRGRAIVARLARILLWLAGLPIAVWGLLAASVSFLPGAEVDVFGSDRPIVGFAAGILAVLAGTVLLVVAIGLSKGSSAQHRPGAGPIAGSG